MRITILEIHGEKTSQAPLRDRALDWAGSEIGDGDMNLRDYVVHLLTDDEPLESHFEEEGEGPFVPCTPPPAFNEADCELAVNPPAP